MTLQNQVVIIDFVLLITGLVSLGNQFHSTLTCLMTLQNPVVVFYLLLRIHSIKRSCLTPFVYWYNVCTGTIYDLFSLTLRTKILFFNLFSLTLID